MTLLTQGRQLLLQVGYNHYGKQLFTLVAVLPQGSNLHVKVKLGRLLMMMHNNCLHKVGIINSGHYGNPLFMETLDSGATPGKQPTCFTS